MFEMLAGGSNEYIFSITSGNFYFALVFNCFLGKAFKFGYLAYWDLLGAECYHLLLKGALLYFPLEDVVEGNWAAELVKFLWVL